MPFSNICIDKIVPNGTTTTYNTQFTNESVTLSSGSASITMSYNNSSAGTTDRTTHVNITPSDEATRSFSKYSRSQGSSYRTDFEAIPSPPPPKSLHIQAGSQEDNGIDLEWDGMTLSYIGLGAANVNTQARALRTISMCDTAIERVSDARATFGAYQNRMEHAYNVNSYTSENLDAAESRIRDTDMAEEMVKYTKHNMLEQVGQSIFSQANQSTQGVLNILGS